jgi:hypothetical protein
MLLVDMGWGRALQKKRAPKLQLAHGLGGGKGLGKNGQWLAGPFG